MTSWLRVLVGLTMLFSAMLLPRHGSNVPLVVFDETVERINENEVTCVGCNPLIFGQPLNINTAPIEHIELLPNIGRKRAQAILSKRQQQTFKTLEDLDDVRGIGPKTLHQLAQLVVFD